MMCEPGKIGPRCLACQWKALHGNRELKDCVQLLTRRYRGRAAIHADDCLCCLDAGAWVPELSGCRGRAGLRRSSDDDLHGAGTDAITVSVTCCGSGAVRLSSS